MPTCPYCRMKNFERQPKALQCKTCHYYVPNTQQALMLNKILDTYMTVGYSLEEAMIAMQNLNTITQ